MNAPVAISGRADAAASASNVSPERPVSFDGLFGWFAPGQARRTVIFCGTLGFEQLSAYRAWRGLAMRVAAAGCSTLRFDYPGEGDSSDRGAGTLDGLVAAVRSAIRFARAANEGDEIALVGLRFGATLAAMAAAVEPVDRLVLLAPFAKGNAFVRQMGLQARTLGTLADGSPIRQQPGALTVGGFRLPQSLIDAAAGIDLTAPPRAPAGAILLLGAPAALAAGYTAAGGAVTSARFDDIGELVGNPLYAVAPPAAFDATVAFVSEGLVGTGRLATDARAGSPIVGDAWSEQAVTLATGAFAVHCTPRGQAIATVLFVNAGRNPRWGWGRQVTDLARLLAQGGVASLRIDLRGIGDSPDLPDGASPLFAASAVDDIRAALDHVDAGGRHATIVTGNCSGAFASFEAMRTDDRLGGALLLNLPAFDRAELPSTPSRPGGGYRSTVAYVGMLARPAMWRRLATGDIRVAAIAWTLFKRCGASVRARGRAVLGRTRPDPVAAALAALRRRGARLAMLYSEADVGLDAAYRHLGRAERRIAERIGGPFRVVPGVDHNFSGGDANDLLHDTLSAMVQAMVSQRAEGSAQRAVE